MTKREGKSDGIDLKVLLESDREFLLEAVCALVQAALHEIWMAGARKDAEAAFEAFTEIYAVKYDRAGDCLVKDREALPACYDFSAEHWRHLRTSNPVESSFATVRHRTVRAKGCLSNRTALAMSFKLAQAAEKCWRRLTPTVNKIRR